MIRSFTTALFVCLFFISAMGQTTKSLPGPIVVCPHGSFEGHHYTPVSADILQKISQRDDEPCANITVVYDGFTPEAQNAFQAAVDIWSFSISSPVTIRVSASWEPLGEGVLGAAGPFEIFGDFPNAPNNDYYAGALADQIAGTDLSPGEVDIIAMFNSDFDWYYGLDGAPTNNAYDLVTVVLHELGHGLGFVSSGSYDESNNTGTYGLGAPPIPLHYDRFMVLGTGINLLDIAEGAPLGNAFTSGNVFCNAQDAHAANGGSNPKLYAPAQYNSGSSLSHWDENTFPAGNIHSLMTPQLGPGEAIHNPGPITLGLFSDMGWALCENSGTGEDCLLWQDPTPTTGWTNFNSQFGGAPCDDGSGCPFNEITDFEVLAAEAYSVAGFIAGGDYTFSICNGPGAGSWIPDFTIIAPSGAIDASGNGTGCAISWTASESGTYLIVINEAGNCGVANTINNGYPALTCTDGTADCAPNECSTGDLEVTASAEICPGETTTVNLAVPAAIPAGGGFGIQFYNPVTDDGINLSGVTLPYTFDNDLNGLLTANDFDLFEGEYELVGYVYTDADDPSNTICAASEFAVIVNFLAADDPACIEEEICETGSLIITGETEICPEATTTADLINAADIPQGGGFGIQFYNPVLEDGINLSGVTLPYTFDNDLNGLLTANDFDLFEGEYELVGYVYTDADDPSNTICAVSEFAVIVNFLAADDPACIEEEICLTGTLIITGENEICPDETTVTDLINAADIPQGGGFGIQFYNPVLEDGINLSGVTLPYTFDNDLNGLLTANDFDLFEGEYELVGYVYTDADDPNNTICAVSEFAVIVNFLAADDPACIEEEICETGSLIITGETEICPEATTTADLINAADIPQGGGFGIQFYNPVLEDGINLSGVTLPYTFDNDLNGLLTANDFDLFEGEYELVGYVYTDADDPNNTICAVSEFAVIVNFLAADDPACIEEEICETGSLIITGETEICPEATTTADLINAADIPQGGGFGIQFYNPATEEGINLSDVTLPYTFDNDLNGLLTANGFDLFEGEYELVGYVYTDPENPTNTICAVSENAVIVTFLAADDASCVSGIYENDLSDGFRIYPNPASESVTIQNDGVDVQNIKLILTDIRGKILLEKSGFDLSQNNSFTLETSTLNQGVYIIVLTSDQGTVKKRLVINR